MEMSAYQEAVRRFIVENFLFGEGDRVRDESPLMESGIVDSTGILEIVNHIESTYGIAVEEDELVPENLNSIASVARYIARKLDGAGGA